MTYEHVLVRVGNKTFEVLHCTGNKQGICDQCKRKKKYGLYWTTWLYKLVEDGETYCYDCLLDELKKVEKK